MLILKLVFVFCKESSLIKKNTIFAHHFLTIRQQQTEKKHERVFIDCDWDFMTLTAGQGRMRLFEEILSNRIGQKLLENKNLNYQQMHQVFLIHM